MRKIACQYAIVRFMPYVETDEFANVGIAMISAEGCYFGFKLQTRRHGRVGHFFRRLDKRVFVAAMSNLKEEMDRIHNKLTTDGFDRRLKFNDGALANRLFDEMIRPRETIIRFSRPRAVLTSNPKDTLTELFQFYVERNFATPQSPQSKLDSGIRKLLDKHHLRSHFQELQIGDDAFSVGFPFVEMLGGCARKVIKPLNLGQDSATRILEHGDRWAFRIRGLKKRNRLPPQVLFAVDGPKDSQQRENAFLEARNMLTDTGVTVLAYSDQQSILTFALAGISLPQSRH